MDVTGGNSSSAAKKGDLDPRDFPMQAYYSAEEVTQSCWSFGWYRKYSISFAEMPCVITAMTTAELIFNSSLFLGLCGSSHS